MSADRADRIERAVDASAAVLLAAATAYCGLSLSVGLPMVSAAGIAAFCGAYALLRVIAPEDRQFPMRGFVPIESPQSIDEPVEDQTVQHPAPAGSPELLLDDVLAELEPDSRVVRLFDPAAMPTPAELRARIDRHLGSARAPSDALDGAGVDASQALHEALAELRRSLR